MSATSLIPSATVESLVAQRAAAMRAFEGAYEALGSADAALRQAWAESQKAAPARSSYNHHNDELRKGLAEIKVPDRDLFLDTARRITDADIWAHILTITDLERLMDKKAKDEFRQQLVKDPPEVTVETVRATLEQFALDAGTIFARGVAECFSNLDRRFRSHDGWKIGNRVILSHAFDEWGHWSYHRNHRDSIQDIERAFFVLDGREPPHNYGGLVGAIDEARGRGMGRRQAEVETEFFKLRTYKNGNAHLWFKRDDLLAKVNRVLADYYGEVIPEEREPDEDTGLNDPKTSLARNYGFFPSPDAVAHEVVEWAGLYRPRDGEPPLAVLEPSAGEGALASLCADKGAEVDCIEINAERAWGLGLDLRFGSVVRADFLLVEPEKLYDRVVMNPPFDRERDIDHVMHALKFLKPDGMLVSVMSAGTEFRETRKARAFRDLMQRMKARWRDLPPRSFAEVGTNVNTLMVKVRKDGESVW